MTIRALLLAALAALTCGCGSDAGRVSGTVSVGGQPLSQGTVVFEDRSAGISVNATIGPNGKYTAKTYDLNGLPPGKYQVAVRPDRLGDGETPLVSDPSGESPDTVSAIPEKFHSLETSGLTATVEAGANESFDFDLEP